MPAAMPCKIPMCQSTRETCRNVGKHKTKYVCIAEADESMTMRVEGAPHRYHEDHIAGKGIFIMSLQFLFTNSFRCLKHSKKSRCTGSSGERMGRTGENPSMAADETQKQEIIDR